MGACENILSLNYISVNPRAMRPTLNASINREYKSSKRKRSVPISRRLRRDIRSLVRKKNVAINRLGPAPHASPSCTAQHTHAYPSPHQTDIIDYVTLGSIPQSLSVAISFLLFRYNILYWKMTALKVNIINIIRELRHGKS